MALLAVPPSFSTLKTLRERIYIYTVSKNTDVASTGVKFKYKLKCAVYIQRDCTFRNVNINLRGKICIHHC